MSVVILPAYVIPVPIHSCTSSSQLLFTILLFLLPSTSPSNCILLIDDVFYVPKTSEFKWWLDFIYQSAFLSNICSWSCCPWFLESFCSTSNQRPVVSLFLLCSVQVWQQWRAIGKTHVSSIVIFIPMSCLVLSIDVVV